MDARLKQHLAYIQKTGHGKAYILVKHIHGYAVHEILVSKDGTLNYKPEALSFSGATLHDIAVLIKLTEKLLQDGCVVTEGEDLGHV